MMTCQNLVVAVVAVLAVQGSCCSASCAYAGPDVQCGGDSSMYQYSMVVFLILIYLHVFTLVATLSFAHCGLVPLVLYIIVIK